jgi:hypothetical protein
MGEMKHAYKILIGELEGKRPLVTPRRRWEVILEWFLGIWGEEMWTGFIWLR